MLEHTAQKSTASTTFGKSIGTRCAVNAIEYVDDQNQDVSISCYFANGEQRSKSKGLPVLTKDLNVSIHPSVKLAEFCTVLESHPAFQKFSSLENAI